MSAELLEQLAAIVKKADGNEGEIVHLMAGSNIAEKVQDLVVKRAAQIAKLDPARSAVKMAKPIIVVWIEDTINELLMNREPGLPVGTTALASAPVAAMPPAGDAKFADATPDDYAYRAITKCRKDAYRADLFDAISTKVRYLATAEQSATVRSFAACCRRIAADLTGAADPGGAIGMATFNQLKTWIGLLEKMPDDHAKAVMAGKP